MGWRKGLDSMQKRMLSVYNKNMLDICHDVTFLVGEDKEEISCHKIFLVIASPVFETMFSNRHNSNGAGGDGDCNNNNNNPITIPDVHPDGLRNVIKYAYTGILNVDVTNLMITMCAADKYDIPELTKYCSEQMHKNLSMENVVTVHQGGQLLNDKKLAKSAWTLIEAKSAALLDLDQFLLFSGENLRKFLSLDSIPNLRSEVDVFKALLRWGTFQCKQRDLKKTEENMTSVVEPYLSLIRFPAMDADEFNNVVEKSGVLTSKECIELYKYFITYGQERLAIGFKLKYNCKSRVDGKFVFSCATVNKKLEITNNGADVYPDLKYRDFSIIPKMFRFTLTSKSGNAVTIKLKSIGIVLPSKSKKFKPQCISIGLHDPSIDKWIHTAKAKVTKSLEIFYVKVDPPVSLKCDVRYFLRVNISNGDWVEEKVEFVNYSKELLNQSTFTWNTAGKHHLKLDFIPNGYTIWALQFEY